MKSLLFRVQLVIIASFLFQLCDVNHAIAQDKNSIFINGDALPDAPELSPRGIYAVGVQTVEVINKNQIDVLHSVAGVDPLYDRHLTLEIWYPAQIKEGKKQVNNSSYNNNI